MRTLTAFFVMSLIGVVATALAAVSALIQMLPVILVLAAVLVVARWCSGRAAARTDPAHRPSVPVTMPTRRARSRPLAPHPDAWLVVPVWMSPTGAADRRPYIDGVVIGEDDPHG